MGGPHGWQTSYKAWESDDSDRREDVPSIPRLAVGVVCPGFRGVEIPWILMPR